MYLYEAELVMFRSDKFQVIFLDAWYSELPDCLRGWSHFHHDYFWMISQMQTDLSCLILWFSFTTMILTSDCCGIPLSQRRRNKQSLRSKNNTSFHSLLLFTIYDQSNNIQRNNEAGLNSTIQMKKSGISSVMLEFLCVFYISRSSVHEYWEGNSIRS